MRKLMILIAFVFITSICTVAVGDAATCPTKSKVSKRIVSKHKVKCTCKAKRHSMPARAARGPVVTCPAPIVNVPKQAPPVVNVPQQPAPVVNVAAPPPSVSVTSDNNYIYIVRENQLMIMDKCNYSCVKTVTLQ